VFCEPNRAVNILACGFFECALVSEKSYRAAASRCWNAGFPPDAVVSGERFERPRIAGFPPDVANRLSFCWIFSRRGDVISICRHPAGRGNIRAKIRKTEDTAWIVRGVFDGYGLPARIVLRGTAWPTLSAWITGSLKRKLKKEKL
jgi:hypothetical protein